MLFHSKSTEYGRFFLEKVEVLHVNPSSSSWNLNLDVLKEFDKFMENCTLRSIPDRPIIGRVLASV
jgi:hypothetical protein